MSNRILAAGDEQPMQSIDILKYLDGVQAERFVAFQETFETDGWKLVQEWAQVKVAEAEHRAIHAKSWEENRTAYGARDAWTQVYNMADMFMNEFEHVATESMMGQDSDPT